MKCLLVFDHLNDVVYTKYDQKFSEHITEFATLQGFFNNPQDASNAVDDNILVQIFSPIVTSQRIMNCQFGNSYTSIQCEGGVNICFDDYMGYLFLSVAEEDVQTIKKYLSICITVVRYLCGPDVCQLKSSIKKSNIATDLIDSWFELQSTDQAVFVEAVEQLVVNSDVSSVTLQVLRKAVDKLVSSIECSKIHALVLVNNKFLSLYSSQNAKELCAADILFTTIVSQSSTKKFASSESSNIDSLQVLLAGCDQNPCCLAHVVHVIPLCEGINLIFLLEIGNLAISSSLYDAFHHLHTMQIVQIQKDTETLRPAFENLDLAMKRLNDALKKNKNSENCTKHLTKKWDMIRKKYLEFLKTTSDEALLRAETLVLGLLENLKELLILVSVDEKMVVSTQKQTAEAAMMVCDKLNNYNEFLKVKSIRNFTLGSRDSLTINKYLEEFPGLVHFLYVDRVNHRVTAPTLDFSADETNKLTKNKIWAMVKFARNHLQEGNLSLMWKDTIFNYAYFLWFEDISGTSLKPVVYPTNASKALPLPGLLGTDFYQKLKEVCFPKMQSQKIRCYELFCVHLGLVTASCVLEHTRRLAATIWELRGFKSHPIDLL